jgi:hypothetical protein
MTLVSLGHAVDCLLYLSMLRDQSVFNFCAIPQVMAISTLALVYRNPAVFERNIKIRRGESCKVPQPQPHPHKRKHLKMKLADEGSCCWRVQTCVESAKYSSVTRA